MSPCLPVVAALVMLSTAACERQGTAPPSAAPILAAPADPAPAEPVAAEPVAAEPVAAEPADVAQAPPSGPTIEPEPAAPGDPTEAARILADYHRIERFLRPRPADKELSKADTKLLRAYLGKDRFAWYESEGRESDVIRQAWLEHMSAEATKGHASTIRMPLYPNVGWGCEVPSIWVASGNFSPDVTFILPEGNTTVLNRCEKCFDIEDGDGRDRCEMQHCSMQVEGHFTGKTTKATEHCDSEGYYFHIDRATTRGSGDAYFLALPAGAAPPDGPPITEGPRWGVLFASAFRHQDDARDRADALHARLVEKGHATAQVLDSRRIPTLWCCSFAVLVDRFDDEKTAKTLAKTLEREGFGAALVRKLY